jgi:hypothetical protein
LRQGQEMPGGASVFAKRFMHTHIWSFDQDLAKSQPCPSSRMLI